MSPKDQIQALSLENYIVSGYLALMHIGDLSYEHALEQMVIALAAENETLASTALIVRRRGLPPSFIVKDQTQAELITAAHKRSVPLPEPISPRRAKNGGEFPKERIILETKDSNGAALWITEWDKVFLLDSEFSRMGWKVYDQLPRAYGSERGARQAAAMMTGEKLTWTKP